MKKLKDLLGALLFVLIFGTLIAGCEALKYSAFKHKYPQAGFVDFLLSPE